MPKIIPIKELKNTSEISEMCHKTDEPVFITKNGYGDMVIMSIETYEQVQKLAKIYRRQVLSEQDSKAGKKQDAFRVLEEMRGEYSL